MVAFRFRIFAAVVHVQQEGAELRVELRQRQCWLPTHRAARRSIAVQLAQKHLVHGREKPFDAATTPWLARNGKDQPDLQIRAYLFQMIGCEVAAIVRVKHLGDATHDPARILFAPNCLTQRQRCVQRGGVLSWNERKYPATARR